MGESCFASMSSSRAKVLLSRLLEASSAVSTSAATMLTCLAVSRGRLFSRSLQSSTTCNPQKHHVHAPDDRKQHENHHGSCPENCKAFVHGQARTSLFHQNCECACSWRNAILKWFWVL